MKKYSYICKYPPLPTDTLELTKSNSKTGENAWKWIISLNKQYPVNEEFYKHKFYKELQKDLLAYNLFIDLDCKEILNNYDRKNDIGFVNKEGLMMVIGFGYGYRKDKFIQRYNHSINL